MFVTHPGRVTLAVTAAIAVVAALVPPLPAAASEPLLLRHREASAHDLTPIKTVTATCPTGSAVLGTGGQVVAGHGGVRLAAVVPDATLTSVTARGEALPGHAGPWSVVAVAVCGRAPASLQRVASPALLASATCPTHAPVLIGTGFSLAGSPEQARLTGLIPDPAAGRVTLKVAFTGPIMSLPTAYAVCSSATTTHMKQSTSPSNPAAPKTATAFGRPMTGVGGELTGQLAGIFIDALLPAPELDAVAVRATKVSTGADARLAGGEEEEENSWAVTAYGLATVDYY